MRKWITLGAIIAGVLIVGGVDVTTGNFIELAGRTFALIASKVPLEIETDWGRISGES